MSPMAAKEVSQKEYLRRYLSGSKDGKKKNKKKKVSSVQRLHIVDDDIDPKNIRELSAGDLELYELAENAPQVVGIVDERPAELQALETFQNRSKWRVMTDENEDITVELIGRKEEKHDNDSDQSPPRASSAQQNDSDLSPPRPSTDSYQQSIKKKHIEDQDSDLSPPRLQPFSNCLPTREKMHKPKHKHHSQQSSDSDMSPPRKENKNERNGRQKERQDSRSSSSIPRHNHREHNFQESSHNKHPAMDKLQRRNKLDANSDGSSSRSHRNAPASPKRQRHLAERATKRSRRSRWESNDSDSDLSPPRLIPVADQNAQNNPAKNRRQCSVDSDLSPPRHETFSVKIKQEPGTEKQTLDGKRAGLQDAKTLKEETEQLKRKEKDHFEKMSDLVSGRGASTVVRDRKTGKRRDLVKEQQVQQEKEEADKEKLAEFKRLGKGLVQVEQQALRLQEHMHEMNKPLARYAGDQDLEELLKAQEREGDPMLEYLREKKQQENPTASKPRYQGPAPPPNRFNIQPGHRWDGVDRSTGYEKRLFEQMNAKKALEEEAYKWSVSDM